VFSIEELTKNFNGMADFQYSVHVDPDLRFIYFNNPKCACTTTKASLNLSYSQYKGLPLHWSDSGSIHIRRVNFLLTPSQVGAKKFSAMLSDKDVFKFCFMRDPVTRLASGYASKMRWSTAQHRRFVEYAGRPADWRPTFDEFVMDIKRVPALRDRDEHWRLQAKQLCLGKIPFDFVGDFATIGESLHGLLTKFFGSSATVFDARHHFKRHASNSGRFVGTAPPQVLEAIADLYAEDYDWYKTASPWLGTNR